MYKHYDRYVNLGMRIMYFRKKKGLTQEQLAEKINYSRNQIQRVEKAKAQPSLELIFEIAEVLEVDADKLFKPIE